MRVLQINIFGNLSTGRIAVDLYRTLEKHGYEGVIAFARNTIPDDVRSIKIGNRFSVYSDVIRTRITDKAGFFSKGATKRLIEKINEYNPDIVHLHNVHGYYINVELLFGFLKLKDIPVVWTLHDCWAFTGHCCNFEHIECEKWKTCCEKCPQKKSYPASIIIDNSKDNYRRKKQIFTSLQNMTLVTPSIWLKNLVKESYLKDYPIEVIRNGVDLSVFKATQGTWAKNHGLEDKIIVLGVAGTWTPTKGLHDMKMIAGKLSDEYKVVVVGVNVKQKAQLPNNMLGIERTYNSTELAEIYSAAKVFVNPSYEDNFPNVNIEALACGTPVITYKTGGGPEIITGNIGRVVEQGNIGEIVKAIQTIDANETSCINAAKVLDRNKTYAHYVTLYERIMKMRK